MRVILGLILLVLSGNIMGQEIIENILENQMYMQRKETFRENPLTKGQIVFLGNSLTHGGSWDKYFPDQKPANRGISGDNTLGMLGRLHEIIDARPTKIFLLAGINDISLGRSNDKIMTGIKSMIYQIKAGSPETEIYVQSLLPINNSFGIYSRLEKKEKQIEKLNKELKKFCEKEKITFINLYPHFLESKRTLNAKYTMDGLHLNDDGYAIWVKQLETYIK